MSEGDSEGDWLPSDSTRLTLPLELEPALLDEPELLEPELLDEPELAELLEPDPLVEPLYTNAMAWKFVSNQH